MADYPSHVQKIGTTREAASGIRVARSVSGKPRYSRYSSQDWFVFKVQHEGTLTQMQQILSHYTSHRMLEFSYEFTATGETYNVQYSECPKLTPMEGDDRWSVESYLIGTGRLPYGVAVLNLPVTVTATGESTSRSKAVSVAVSGAIAVGTVSVGKKKVVTVSSAALVSIAKKKAAIKTVTVSASSSVTATGVKA